MRDALKMVGSVLVVLAGGILLAVGVVGVILVLFAVAVCGACL